MSKHFHKDFVRKATTFSPRTTERAGAPIPKTVEGRVVLMCPFCKAPHPIIPGIVAACGSTLQVRAVQTIYKAKYEPSMICAKCGKGGGDMVLVADAFFHVEDCNPGVLVMTDPPEFSEFAKRVFLLPDWLKKIIEPQTGTAMPVDEVLSDGTRTGVTLGYFFKEKTNAKRSATQS